ncbi:Chain length determinant protein [Blastococcus tunisiensis]|uniref:Chain length determinant protein n=1 Tax=Blastococcus tunisiensis TaxID=1798228 RepID=A0A1I2JC50_9ACTN|nr:Chain length determinant protein [Blastococcus sp. DSM 46838]
MGALVAAGVSMRQAETFEAKTRLLVEPQDETRVLDPYAPLPADDSTVDSPGRRLWTHAEQIQSDSVAAEVRRSLRIDTSTRELLEQISVSPVGLGYTIQITATGDSAEEAIALANGFANAYISHVGERNADAKAAAASTITEGLESMGDASAQGEVVDRLAVRADELLIEATLPLTNISVVNEAVEATRTAPLVFRDAVLAAVLVAFLTAGTMILAAQGRRGRSGAGVAADVHGHQ